MGKITVEIKKNTFGKIDHPRAADAVNLCAARKVVLSGHPKPVTCLLRA